MQGNELEALCSAWRLLARATEWLGFEINAMTTAPRDALRIRTLVEHMGMTQRAVPGIPEWRWADVGFRTGYMVMYARPREGAGRKPRRADHRTQHAKEKQSVCDA